MANANIKQIFQEFPSNGLSPDDLLVFYNEVTGTTRAIKASDAIPNTSNNQSFIWNSTGEYNTGDVVIYQGQWYISLVDNNEVIPTNDNINWERENKVTTVTVAPWEPGIYESHYSVVSVGTTIYRLKDTATLPLNSQTSPELDPTNWESFGGGGITDENIAITSTNLVAFPGVTNQKEYNEANASAILKARGTEVSGGGFVTLGTTSFTVGNTEGQIYDGVTYKAINYIQDGATAALDITQPSTYVYFDINGNIQQQFTAPTNEEFRTKLFLTRIASNGTAFVAQERLENPSGQYTNLVRDLVSFLSSLKKGLSLVPNADRTFQRSAGTVFELGSGSTYLNPNVLPFPLVTPAPFFQQTRSGAPTLISNGIVNNNDYNPTGNTLTAMTANRWRIDTVYFFTSGNISVQIGQNQYVSLAEAEAALSTRTFELNPANQNGTRLGWIFIMKGATDLSNPAQAKIKNDEGNINTSEALVGVLLRANNLSDLANIVTARTNLGLGTAAVKNTGSAGDTIPLLNQLAQWSNFNQFDRQVQINQYLTFGITDVILGGTLANNYAVDNSVISLDIASTSDLIVNSILPAIATGDNNNSNRILIFRNESVNSHNINIINGGTGLVANRFYLDGNVVIPPKNSAVFIYRDETEGQDGWYLLATSFSGASYTDQQARAAQALLKSTGTVIQFDRPREYGNPTAETGNITFDFTSAISGTTQLITHNSVTKPTMPASANKLSGDYSVSLVNQIYLTPILVSTGPDVWRVDVTVSQNNPW